MITSNKKFLIAGNWKMNKQPAETVSFIQDLSSAIKNTTCEVVICVPFIDLHSALDSSKDVNIKIGAQNCHWEKNGAFTGEISADMLNRIGCDYVIIGHSERRSYFGETDESVNKRLHAALSSGLKAIVCVGEDLEEQINGVTLERLSIQIKLALKNVSSDSMKNLVIAYEPVWAIGTGKTATSEQANIACAHIRSVVKGLYGAEIAKQLCVLYGGSMNVKNSLELLSQEDIDGGLIGGASLSSEDFSQIIRVADSV